MEEVLSHYIKERGFQMGEIAEMALFFLVKVGKERFLRKKSELRILVESGITGFSMVGLGLKLDMSFCQYVVQ